MTSNADRTDSGGGGRESGVTPSGEEYVIAEVKVCISGTPLVSAVNHMAAQTFREEKTNNKKMSLSFHLILMSTLTWITGKELEREINNNGDQFGGKKNMKLIIWRR